MIKMDKKPLKLFTLQEQLKNVIPTAFFQIGNRVLKNTVCPMF
jgi:hypothetical protein